MTFADRSSCGATTIGRGPAFCRECDCQLEVDEDEDYITYQCVNSDCRRFELVSIMPR